MAKQHIAAAALFVVLAVAMTWPLARTLDRAVAYPGDPYINTWILDWDWYATFHQPLSLFDANIFYPSRYSLAFSENLFGIALLLFPFRAAGLSPIAAHNVAILGGFAFSGFAAYLLGRFIAGSGLAGVVAGIFYAFVPFRFSHLSHVQHVWGGTLPLMLVALLYYARKPTWPRAALFGAAFLFNGLCNIHDLFFGSVAIAFTVLIVRPRLGPLVACTAIAALLMTPFLYPYLAVSKMYGMERSWDETMSYSARPSDWLVSNFHNRVYTPLRNATVDPERWLYPGVLSLILASIALAGRRRNELAVPLLWIVLGFLGSLGLHAFFHRFLFTYAPGFRAIRVPARWAVITYVGLSMLIALATAMLARRRAWAVGLIAAAFVLELRAAPIRWYMASTQIPQVDRWVAKNRPRAIVELPFYGEYGAVFRATAHHRPIVNGASGFAPPQYLRVEELIAQWSDQLIPELKRMGVSHLIVHGDAVTDLGRAWLSRAIRKHAIGFVGRFDAGVSGDWLFAIGGPAGVTPDLEAFLRGERTYSESTFGLLHYPMPGEVLTNRALFSGFAFSPYGIHEVHFLVNNGAIRLPALRRPDPNLSREFRWYDATTAPAFFAPFSKRPKGVWRHTDIQVEIIDGRGERTLLDDRWVDWP
jgi:hypothetical protein